MYIDHELTHNMIAGLSFRTTSRLNICRTTNSLARSTCQATTMVNLDTSISSTMVSELLVRMQKILNLVTNYQDREYFDNISPAQALAHLVADNYCPHDIEL